MRELLINLRMVRNMFRDKKASRWPKIFVIVTFLYLLVPTDIIPDFIPVIGFLDDVGVFTATISMIIASVKKFRNANYFNE